MKLYKMFAAEAERCHSIQLNISQQICYLETANLLKRTVSTLQTSNESLGTVLKSVAISKFEDTLENLCDTNTDQ